MSAPTAPTSVQPGGSPPATPEVDRLSPSASDAPVVAVAAVPAANATGAAATEKRRASHPACARCRRGKIKCVAGENGQLPCAACVTRGVGSLCTRAEPGSTAYAPEVLADGSVRPRKRRAEDDAFAFGTGRSPVMQYARLASYSGIAESLVDDGYGRPARGGHAFRSSASPPRAWQAPSGQADAPSPFGPVPWSLVTDGCQAFVSKAHQLGFLHRPTFLHELQAHTRTYSPFLLLAMLSVSARMTPSLLSYFGSTSEATHFFLSRTHAYLADGLSAPTVERVQALYILSLAESAEGNVFRARMILDLARSMASVLELGKGFTDDQDASTSCIEQEVRRRTWWCLQVEQGCEATPARNVFVPSGLEVVPLPIDEQEFAFGTTTREPVMLPKPATAVETTVSLQTSLLGLLLLSRKLLQDAARLLQEIDDTTIGMLDAIALRLRALESSFSPLQMATTSNFLAYRSQNLDIGFNEVHLNLAVASLLVTHFRSRVDRASSGESAATIDGLAKGVLEKVNQLAVSQSQPILPPIFAYYLSVVGQVLLCHSPRDLPAILGSLEDAAAVWPVARLWTRNLARDFREVVHHGSGGPSPVGSLPPTETSATHAASALAALAQSTFASAQRDAVSPGEERPHATLGWTRPPASSFSPMMAMRDGQTFSEHGRHNEVTATIPRPLAPPDESGPTADTAKQRDRGTIAARNSASKPSARSRTSSPTIERSPPGHAARASGMTLTASSTNATAGDYRSYEGIRMDENGSRRAILT